MIPKVGTSGLYLRPGMYSMICVMYQTEGVKLLSQTIVLYKRASFNILSFVYTCTSTLFIAYFAAVCLDVETTPCN